MPKTPAPKKQKRPDWRRIFVTALAAVMLLSLILPLLTSAMLSARAVTQADLQNQIGGLKVEATDAAARRKELQAQLQAIENDKAKALERHNLMSQQLAVLDAQIANTQSQIDTYTALIAEQEVALAEAQSREEQAYERFCQRARSMEESGTISYWSVLFSASDYSDLLDRLAMVDQIMRYDNSVVDTLAAARQEVETTLEGLNTSKSELDAQKAQLDLQRVEQSTKVAEAQALLDELKTQADKAEALVAAEEAEMAKIEKAIAAKEKELQALIAAANFTTGSGYAYPLPYQYTRLTSLFGPRIHPITKKYNNHTGIDIPAPGGTKVTAVQGGIVVTSAYAPSSYGEYVVIAHGNGVTTLYAHMQRGSRTVREGDAVSQGQVIGLVGTTGSSTGNHLHLEYKVNGVRNDPKKLFPGVKFTDP